MDVQFCFWCWVCNVLRKPDRRLSYFCFSRSNATMVLSMNDRNAVFDYVIKAPKNYWTCKCIGALPKQFPTPRFKNIRGAPDGVHGSLLLMDFPRQGISNYPTSHGSLSFNLKHLYSNRNVGLTFSTTSSSAAHNKYVDVLLVSFIKHIVTSVPLMI